MKKLGLFFIFALTCTAFSCCVSETILAQRRQIEPIVKQPPNGGVSGNPEENFQKSPATLSPKKIFQYALSRYQFGDYAKAESLFAEYRKSSSSEPRSDRELGLLMHAKTLIYLNRAEKAIAELNELRLTLTTSALRQESLFDLAIGEFQSGQNFSAAQHFIEVAGNNWNMQDSVALRRKAVTNLRVISIAHLSADELLKLASSTAYINLRAVLLSESLQKCLAGDVLSGSAGTNGTRQEEAVRAPRQDSILKQQLIPAINRLLGTPSLDPICKTWLESGLEQATAFLSRRMNAYRIGVLVPIDLNVFDGTDAQKIGSQILSGIVYRAYESNRKSATDHVSLFVRNSHGMDGTHLVKTANALIDQESVQLILGPIFSDQAIIVSRACAAKGVTMITPTATDEHITLGINTSFQINPTHNMRGRAIAKYLMQFPTMKTFGIFAEQKTYGVEMAEGFRQ
ncbi:MAG: amino acid ABC transporter substrate-binding protein, partial [Chlorobiales bacterium]|nr:amino acid ABC transporter substrate-binding protein [Chlorobiales bacterium]